ncbi:ExbD/TolR family protein [Planctellipticum variicoloris]|jgi:biopolymer transport protein ExbD|uniref:ExbD/TolR family protein n=1 Tax=Planctellipticum variicoloris TaxID=3064265 RepID=UPI003013A840|nr:biopolymer transporter ExbD [Planctomycetaceae bacterium SH412]
MKRRRVRRRHRDTGEVQLNLAAMLDMAFQLLTFFILTFRPAPIEGQLAVNLPPPVVQTKVEAPSDASDSAGSGEDSLKTIFIHVTADDAGETQQVRIVDGVVSNGPLDDAQLRSIHRRLESFFSIGKVPFDRVQIAVDGRLRYSELMKLVDVATRQKLADGTFLQKISFMEAGP